MKKTAILLICITIISKIFGFIREITLSYFYGASNISDAYLISQTIPTVLFSFIGTAIATGYIPLYSKIEQNYGEEEGIKFTNNLVNILILISTGIIILSQLFTTQLVKMFAAGFKGNTLALAVQFTRISLLGIYFTGLISVFSGFLQIKKNYVIPALIGFPLNLITILSIYLSSKSNLMILAVGIVVSAASQLFLLLPSLHKKRYRYRIVLRNDEYIRRMVAISLPIILGVSVNEINVLVDRTLASSIAEGGISALNYANKLNSFVRGIFVTTIATVIYPMISKLAAQNNINGLKKTVSEAINSINLLVIPASAGAMIFAEPIVKLLFGRGAFDAQAVSMTTDALFFYSIGMIGFGLREILSRAFYSLQDTKTPMTNAAMAMILNIILNIILSKYIGIGGLALATSISAIFCTVLLFLNLRKKIGPFGIKNMLSTFTKIAVASCVMVAIAYQAYSVLLKYLSSNLSVLSSIVIGAIVYVCIISFMKIDEVDSLVMAIKRKLKLSM